MQVDEYFIKGKMYVYGGIPSTVYEYYRRVNRFEPRKWLCIEGILGEAGRYYPKVGDYFMCLGTQHRELSGIKAINGKRAETHIIKFLAPGNKIILDSCIRISRNTIEKWQIAPEHLQAV